MSELSNEVTVGALGFLGAISAAVVAYFGGKGSAAAALQSSLNQSMDLMLRNQRGDNEECERRVKELAVVCRNLEQHILALQNILRRNGIDVPTYQPVEVVSLPKPAGE